MDSLLKDIQSKTKSQNVNNNDKDDNEGLINEAYMKKASHFWSMLDDMAATDQSAYK
jgi:hypothetical protein